MKSMIDTYKARLAARRPPVAGVYRAVLQGERGRHFLSELKEVKLWLHAHGVPSALVPVNAEIIIGAGRVTVDVHLINPDNGRKFFLREGELATGRMTVPLRDDITMPTCFRLINHGEHEGIMT